ncbi:hypothetical protein SBD_3480 [Streptomyces bottropensis ATCC 25435]|uniref:Uncharacterized protein n=1 Tax=Streptomyces bottropensis ATCC 25435 TaxID=1054862 RepID=M3DHE1_9ACTN|nr:hypothetical protein SBD_3480 [Streptomyces bottropensis ATCC 25435]
MLYLPSGTAVKIRQVTDGSPDGQAHHTNGALRGGRRDVRGRQGAHQGVKGAHGGG